ncbi:MAG: phosphoribosylglycinamide formyltransferase [Xanthomonadales bacterium]|nr:phosphoribosylglycinamide formyltransferase [Xanthomonadales bacterium]
MSPRLRTTVLISGSGSNLQALIDARDAGVLPVEIVQVISNEPGARGLLRAQRAGIPTTILEHRAFDRREAFDRALALLIAAGAPQLVVLAGFMRIVGPAVVEAFRGRMINLHPSLLPKFRGTDTYRRALEAGDRQHGASIHFVTEELDGGPVIAQVVIPVRADDDPASLAARLAPMEHRLVVATVELFAAGRVECSDACVLFDGRTLEQPLQLQPDDRLAA